jgi:hypothetical protein
LFGYSVRLIIDLQLEGADAAARATAFAAAIADHEFALPDLLVADILVSRQHDLVDGIALTVEALLLDEEA